MALVRFTLFDQKQTLDPNALTPHTKTTCGQSRRGGFRTSNSRRRSRILGRVAVTMSKAMPKSGGALGLLRVLNTRLCPVPPFELGVTMRSKVGQILAGLLMAAFSVTPTAAQTQSQIEKRYTRDYNQCMDAAEGVTVEMMDCIGAEIDRQDARLNQAYVMVMRPLSRAKKDQLRGLQRSWIRQRDARCSRASNDAGGGSLSGVVYASCILDETIKRTIFLENYKG